jgi:phosphoserine aminotransferase
MTRAINFNAGPATLPLEALETARDELLDFEGTGMSILEHSHRAKAYARVHEETKALFHELLDLPKSHRLLFMQGGASAQFALVPMNLLGAGSADYIDTGTWASKAFKEAKIVGNARLAGTGKVGDKYTRVPTQAELELDPNAAYLHMCSNNTIMGTQFHAYPETGDVPLVCDMSSDFMWKPIDVAKFGMIYAGAQKNIGPAGITVVIIREDLLDRVPPTVPQIFRYSTVAEGDSLHNTIPVFPVYMVRNVLRWMKAQGGTAAMEKRNQEKAGLLYEMIDQSPDFFRSPIERESRSVMNPVFRLPNEELEKQMVAAAEKQNIVGIKGHRSVGGIRVSMYNAAPVEWVRTFVEFAREFQRTRG